jgi:hypothetical protein
MRQQNVGQENHARKLVFFKQLGKWLLELSLQTRARNLPFE